jgi:vanillate O-demethylase ferredoxin subunit
MIEAVKAAAAARGFAKDHIHFELFAPAKPAGGDESFDIELRASGKTLTVPPGKSIIDVLLEAGLDPLFDCRRGDCGICQTTVIEGIPDHRDVILSDSEKASNTVMQICVSRAKSKKLVLDL